MRGKPVSRSTLYERLRDSVDAFVAATPARFAIAIFAGLVIVFTLLFSLPIATTSGTPAPLVDAFFTAVSVICVTGTLHGRHGHVLVADRARVRVRGSGDRRRGRADRGIHSRTRHQPQARTSAEAARGGRLQPAAHPQRPDLRESGRAARRNRKPAGHRRGERARDRGSDCALAAAADARRGRANPRRAVAVGVHLGDVVHEHWLPADGRGAGTVRG